MPSISSLQVLRQHAPDLDDEVRDYVVSILESQETDPISNSAELKNELLLQFLSENIVDELMSAISSSSPAPQTTELRPIQKQVVDKMVTIDESSTGNDPVEHIQKNRSRRNKKTKRKAQKNKKKEISPINDEFVDDDASAWRDCQAENRAWGGRGFGGRGVRGTRKFVDNFHLANVSLTFCHQELLQSATINLVRGHVYGLVGRNGVGKSTLMRRLHQKAIPGVPADLTTILVKQQIEGRADETALEALVNADKERLWLMEQQEKLEESIENMAADQAGDGSLETIMEELEQVLEELEFRQADTAEERAVELLKGLQFSDEMIQSPTENLSGGWRMRLALAQALYLPSDLICLDECTNHLDIFGLEWLISYLQESDHTVLVVSHDRAFLDSICTDIIVMEHGKLKYHVGNYSEYERQIQEKAAREMQILDAAERQRKKKEAFIQQQSKKSADPNKQRQAKMIKEKKLERIGNYREDGKRYKTNSLKKLSEDYFRMAQKVHIEVDEPVVNMQFPDPTWPAGISPDSPIVRLEDAAFSYGKESPLLYQITLNVNRGSKIALVGRNGSGKTSLLKLIKGEIPPSKETMRKGELWRHPNIRIGHLTQYSVEELEAYREMTVVEYAAQKLCSGKASASIIASASGNVRQYLGAFGLGGKHAHRPIRTLSGGERMRLCFATVLAEEPHCLFLDESTNHVDIHTLESMSEALNRYQGSVVMVSHNQSFLSGFCRELWVLENGRIEVRHSDTESFDEIFSKYRSEIMSGSSTLSAKRRLKAVLAKKATQQRAGATQNVAFM